MKARGRLFCSLRNREAALTAAQLTLAGGLAADTAWQMHRQHELIITAQIYALFNHGSPQWGLLGVIFPILEGIHVETLAVMEGQFFAFAEYVITAGIIGALALLGFMAYAASRPADNALRQVVGMLLMRLAVTAGVGVVDVPLTLAAPPLGGAVDLASLLGLAAYWIYGFWKSARAFLPAKPPGGPQPPTIVYMQPSPGQAIVPMPAYERASYPHAAPPYPAE